MKIVAKFDGTKTDSYSNCMNECQIYLFATVSNANNGHADKQIHIQIQIASIDYTLPTAMDSASQTCIVSSFSIFFSFLFLNKNEMIFLCNEGVR